MSFSKQIVIGCLVLLAISAFSEAKTVKKVVTKRRWQKEFREGKYPYDYYDSDFGANFKKTLHMHRGQKGYTMKNSAGQNVVVTKPFRFRKGRGSCPEFQITCPRGQVRKEQAFTQISLPYKSVPQAFRNPWRTIRCRVPPACTSPRRLSASRKVVTKRKWQKMFRNGKYPRGADDSDFTYNFKRTLHMRRGQKGYTLTNGYGRDVLVTKPFRFFSIKGVSCPEYQITCPPGQNIKELAFTDITLPYKISSRQSSKQWQSTRKCRLPPICKRAPVMRRL